MEISYFICKMLVWAVKIPIYWRITVKIIAKTCSILLELPYLKWLLQILLLRHTTTIKVGIEEKFSLIPSAGLSGLMFGCELEFDVNQERGRFMFKIWRSKTNLFWYAPNAGISQRTGWERRQRNDLEKILKMEKENQIFKTW